MSEPTGLDEQRDFLLRSLDDLEREHDAGDVDEVDYVALRDSYTTRAAAVIRALDGGGTVATAVPAVATAAADRGRRRVWTTVFACVIVAGLVSFAVVRFVAPRPVGGTATGGAPDSISTLLVQARQSQGADTLGAIKLYQQVLTRDPDNAEARTYVGWLVASQLLRQGLSATTALASMVSAMDASEALLDRAIVLDPTYADPKCFKGIVRFRFYADAPGAKSAVDACLAANPPEVVKGLVQKLQTDVNAALAGG